MQANDRLGKYVLREKLGEGGFGEVWKAEEIDRPGTFVAVKVPTGPDAVAALRKEGTLQDRLTHPNIVRAIELDLANDPPYLVTEYVHGESLRQRLDREKKLDPLEAVLLMEQVLAALQAAHTAGVIHRDVKPGNILLGHDGLVKLADFGLGRAVQAAQASIERSTGRSGTGGPSVVGTWHYMSPEQLKGSPGDARSDIYACGVVLYEMLMGDPSPILLPLPHPAPRARLSDTVRLAVAPAPARRFPSAYAMARSLRPQPRPGNLALFKFWRMVALFVGVALAMIATKMFHSSPSVPPGPGPDGWHPADAVVPASAIRCIAFAPDGKTLFAASSDGPLRSWSVEEGRVLASARLASAPLHLAVRPDGKLLAVSDADGKIHVLSLPDFKEADALSSEGSELTSLAFGPRGVMLAAGTRQGEVKLWGEWEAGTPRAQPLGAWKEYGPLDALHLHNSRVNSIAFSGDGGMMLTASEDSTACLWSVEKRETTRYLNDVAAVRVAFFSRPEGVVVTCNQGTYLSRWSLPGGKRFVYQPLRCALQEFSLSHDDIGVCPSPDGLKVAAFGWQENLGYVWSASEGYMIAELKDYRRREGPSLLCGTCVAISPDGHILVSAHGDMMRVWSIAEETLLRTFVPPEDK